MCDKGPVQPLPGGAGHGAGWGTLVGAGGLNNYSICTSCVHHVKTKTYNIAAIGDPVHFYISGVGFLTYLGNLLSGWWISGTSRILKI